jgi:hypothetical protein
VKTTRDLPEICEINLTDKHAFEIWCMGEPIYTPTPDGTSVRGYDPVSNASTTTSLISVDNHGVFLVSRIDSTGKIKTTIKVAHPQKKTFSNNS